MDAVVVSVQMTALVLVADDAVAHADIVIALYGDHRIFFDGEMYVKVRSIPQPLEEEQAKRSRGSVTHETFFRRVSVLGTEALFCAVLT